jgi:hypothetical protein
MQRVFGEASCIRGISANASIVPHVVHPKPPDPAVPGTVRPRPDLNPDVMPEVGDWEVVPILRKYNTRAILFGIPEVNPFDISGFNTDALIVGEKVSPVPNSSPELYWANNVLHTSEWSGLSKPAVRTIHGYDGADGMKSFVANVPRAKVQIVHMQLASEKDYLKPDFAKAWTKVTSASPSLAYAYAHPDSPKVPAEARLSAEEVNAAYAKEDEALKWLTENFFPSNAGSRFLASSDFERLTSPSTGFSISVAALQAALTEMLVKWGNNTFPPDYILADGHYLSLADLFQVMTDSLAEFDRTGKLPKSVKVVRVYGPIGMEGGHGPNEGEMSVATIARQCSQIAPRLHDETADPIPHNSIPPALVIDGTAITSAQFLKLMAQAMVNPVPDTKLSIRMTYGFTGLTQMVPRTRPITDTGATWTFKPAPLEAPGVSQAMQ